MRAAIYTRVSHEEQAREGLSLEMQAARCREAAERLGATTIEEFCDPGVSASTLDRPALRRLLDDLASYDLLCIYDQDRLTRSMQDLLNILAALPDLGVRIYAVTQGGYLSDASDAARETYTLFRGVIAQDEIRRASRRVRAVLNRRAEQGHYQGRLPYGYEWDDGGEGDLVPVREEAAVVREMFAAYAGGRGYARIAQDLNGRGVRGKNGSRQWTPSRVRRMLSNPVYVGLMNHHEQVVPGRHEPIITETRWQEVQDRAARQSRVQPRARNEYTLGPLLRCGLCGGPVGKHCTTRGTGKRVSYQYYCVQRRHHPPAQRHESVMISVEPVHAVVWGWTEHLVSEHMRDRAVEVVAEILKGDEGTRTREAMRERLAALEREMEYNLSVAREGGLPPGRAAALNESLMSEHADLRSRLLLLPEDVVRDAEWWRKQTRVSVSAIQDQPLGEQLEWLLRLYTHVELRKEHLTFHHRLPLETMRLAMPAYDYGAREWSEVQLRRLPP